MFLSSSALYVINGKLVQYFRIFRMGSKKAVPTNFPPVTSTNVGVSSPKCLTSSFNPFATLVLKLKVITSASPKLLNLNQEHL